MQLSALRLPSRGGERENVQSLQPSGLRPLQSMQAQSPHFDSEKFNAHSQLEPTRTPPPKKASSKTKENFAAEEKSYIAQPKILNIDDPSFSPFVIKSQHRLIFETKDISEQSMVECPSKLFGTVAAEDDRVVEKPELTKVFGLFYRSAKHTVYDEAFLLSMQKECSILSMTVAEFAHFLKFLGYDVHYAETRSSSKDDIVELSMLHFAALGESIAEAMALHDKELFPDDSSYKSQRTTQLRLYDKAAWVQMKLDEHPLNLETVMHYLIKLVQGHYEEVKRYIFTRCRERVVLISNIATVVNTKYAQPLGWPEEVVREFLECAGLNPDELPPMNGEDLLHFDPRTLKHLSNTQIANTCVLVRTLVLLNFWWDEGLRPSDSYDKMLQFISGEKDVVESKNPAGLVIMSPVRAPQPETAADDKSEQSSKKYSDWGVLDSESLAIVPYDADVKSITGGMRRHVTMPDATNSRYVQVANFDDLLSCMLMLNRVHAWEVPIVMLTTISNIMGYKKGYILDDTLLNDILNEVRFDIDYVQPHKYSECLWVYLGENEAGTINQLEASTLLRAHVEITTMFLKPIPRHYVPGTFPAKEYLVLLPKECLRLILTQAPLFEFTSDNPKVMLFERDDLEIGMCVRVVTFEVLVRLCTKYFSWDRPSAEMLRQLAGNECEVLSISKTDRIGVRIPGTKICEAIPIEALRSITQDAKLR